MVPQTIRNALAGSLVLASTLLASTAFAADRDHDGIDDLVDNCLWRTNPLQVDTDNDGFGNACDADLNNDGTVTYADLQIMRSAYFGVRPNQAADLTEDGEVGIEDFRTFFGDLGSEPGPGALGDAPNDFECDGQGGCTVPVIAGVDFELPSRNIAVQADGRLHLTGNITIPTPAGSILLPFADLLVEPGVSLEGTALAPDYTIGLLGDAPPASGGGRVYVRIAPGRELADVVEIPLNDDVVYVVFESNNIVKEEIGDIQLTLPGHGWKLVLDPMDPFIYAAGEFVVPVPSGTTGVSLEEAAFGLGVSLSGRIPFEVDTVDAIASAFPQMNGDLTTYVRGSLSPAPIGIEGYSVLELDPDHNGHPFFGDHASTGGDYRLGIDGSVTLDLSVVPGFSLTLGKISGSVISSYTRATSRNPRIEHWISARLPDVDDLNVITRNLMQLDPNERSAFVLYLGDAPTQNYFRFAAEHDITIDSQSMAARHGVHLGISHATHSQFEINHDAIELTGQSYSVGLHSDVIFTKEQRTQLTLPWADDQQFEYRVDTEAELGGIALKNYGMRLTQDVFQHWGRFETPDFSYELHGEYGANGPSMTGTYARSLPYRYADYEAAIDLIGQIAAQEAVVVALDRDFEVDYAALLELERNLRQKSNQLDAARSALKTAESRLSAAKAQLASANYSCGTCAWYDAPCWARVGICEVGKPAARWTAQALVDAAKLAVRAAQAGVTAYQVPVQQLELAALNGRRAVELLAKGADDARRALVLLREHRTSLPEVDGVIDAVVSLELSRTGLTGTVSGDFNGFPIGTGRVIASGGRHQACFVVPNTNEELCMDL